MKKELKAVIAVILAVWFFFMGFELGAFREKKKEADEPTAAPIITEAPTAPAVPSETQPVVPVVTDTTAPLDTQASVPASSAPASSAPAQTTPAKKPSTDVSKMSKDQIIKNMTTAVNTLKHSNSKFTASKAESVKIELVELSVASLKNTVQNILNGMMGDSTESYTFENGVGSGKNEDGKDVSDVKINDVLPPNNADFALSAAGVKSADVKKDGDKTVYHVVLVEEKTTLESPVPKYTAAAFSYLDLAGLSIPTVTITQADMNYPGTEITVETNADGLVTKIIYNMSMNGTGAAKIAVVNGSATIKGNDTEAWTITY